MLDIRITLGSTTPIYWQIVDQVCRAIEAGELVPGDQLPSVRSLAEQLVVNPNTVARAYTDLTREGIVGPQRGKGLFVAERRSVLSETERNRRLQHAVDVFLHEVRLLDLAPTEVLRALEQRLNTDQHVDEKVNSPALQGSET